MVTYKPVFFLQEIAQTRPYIPDPADRLGVGESRDDDSDDDDYRNQRFNGSRDTLLDNQVPRLQLDGGSSEDDHQRGAPLTEPRQSAEGEVVSYNHNCILYIHFIVIFCFSNSAFNILFVSHVCSSMRKVHGFLEVSILTNVSSEEMPFHLGMNTKRIKESVL